MTGQNSQTDNLRGEVTNFGKQIDYSKDLTEGDINGYIVWRIAIWKDSQYRDRELWIAFIDDFEDFKKDTFDIASKDLLRKLRDFLRANGVYVHRQARVPMAKELFKVVQEDKPHEWTKEEIEDQINSSDRFNSILTSRLPAISTTPAIVTTIPPPPTAVTATISAPPTAATTAIPAPSVITTAGHGHELKNLSKTYEDEVKYGGVMDTFNHGKADIVNYEGEERQGNDDIPLDKLDLHDDLETLSLETDNDPDHDSDQITTIFGAIDGRDVLKNLADKSTYITGAGDRYTQEFYGIIFDTMTSNWSTTGYGQHMVYRKYEDIEFDESKPGAINVQFGIGSSTSIEVTTINTPIGRVTFDAVTLFLLCLRDMDRLGIYFDSHPMHGKSPSRFLHDNADFNYSIYVDVMYSHPSLHVVDEDARSQATHWLQNLDKSDESHVNINFNWVIPTHTIKVLNARIRHTQQECLPTGFITADSFIATDSFKKFLRPTGIG